VDAETCHGTGVAERCSFMAWSCLDVSVLRDLVVLEVLRSYKLVAKLVWGLLRNRVAIFADFKHRLGWFKDILRRI
jgi:hypothetical protein